MFDKKAPEKVKEKMYKTMVRPALLYKMGTVAVTTAQKDKIRVAEMKMLRWSLGLTKLEMRISGEK